MSPGRRLVINADDFGFTRDVNEGILDAHRNGILTATTLMANGPAFDDAVGLARDNPSLDVGCHLVLVGGLSVLPPYRPLPSTISSVLRAVVLRRIRLCEEMAAQVRKIRAAGIEPTHLDTHKHVHVLPPVLEALARISEEFRIPWVRRPLPAPFLTNGSQRLLRRYGCRTTDHFTGFRLTGRLDTRRLAGLIRSLPEGTTELMCHPGRCGHELRAAATRLKESRETERSALIAPEAREALEQSGVRLANFRDLET